MHARAPRRRPALTGVLAAALASIGMTLATGTTNAAPPVGDAPLDVVVLTTTSDGQLAWPSPPAAMVLGRSAELGWDLTGLDATRYRGDLARVRLDRVEGPGRFTASAAPSFRDPEILIDSAAGVDQFVLQVGRHGTMQWAFDEPGTYRIELTATLPAASGGLVAASAAFDVTVVDDPSQPRDVTEALVVSPAEAVAAVQRKITSDPVTYRFVVGDVGDPGGRLVLHVGHTDAVSPVFEDGKLILKTKDDTQLHGPGIVFRDPAGIIFQALPAAEMPIPALPAFEFLGNAGDPVWMLPMTQNPALLWPGWSTEHSSLAGEFTSIDYEVTGVSGPGAFHLFLTDTFGNPIHRANSVGTLSNTWTEPVPAHVHANWAFTQPGTYEITFRVSGTWLNAPDPQDPTDPGSSSTTTTTTTSIPGAGGGSTTTTTTAGASRGGGGGPLANAGSAHLGATVTTALACLAIGVVLVRLRRRGRPSTAA